VTSNYDGFTYLRDLRYFGVYMETDNEIRYTRRNMSLIVNSGYYRFDFIYNNLITLDYNNVSITLSNVKPGYSIEQLLPEEIPSMPVCDEDYLLVNNTCVNSNYTSIILVTINQSIYDCTIYNNVGQCVQCGTSTYILNHTCVRVCPLHYIEYFKTCYPCSRICDLSTSFILKDCATCNNKDTSKRTYYNSFEQVITSQRTILSELQDESKDNFFLELFFFIPDFYSLIDSKEYMVFSLFPYKLTLNNSLLIVNLYRDRTNQSNFTIFSKLSIDFNSWNYIVIEHSKIKGVVNIYFNSNKITVISGQNQTFFENSLYLNDLVTSYNYSLSYFKYLRIWGKNSNMNIINFYQNYNLYI
jgi:hypothetical protein